MSVEEVFRTDAASGVTTEQEVIDGLRKVRLVTGGCSSSDICWHHEALY